MDLLRRFLGGSTHDAAPGGRRWFDYPSGGGVDVAGAHYRLEAWQRAFHLGPAGDTRLAQAELIREPTNRHDHNAVMVLVRGEHVGYLPAGVALLWSPYLARMESDGYRLRATVKVWGRLGKGHSTRCSATRGPACSWTRIRSRRPNGRSSGLRRSAGQTSARLRSPRGMRRGWDVSASMPRASGERHSRASGVPRACASTAAGRSCVNLEREADWPSAALPARLRPPADIYGASGARSGDTPSPATVDAMEGNAVLIKSASDEERRKGPERCRCRECAGCPNNAEARGGPCGPCSAGRHGGIVTRR